MFWKKKSKKSPMVSTENTHSLTGEDSWDSWSQQQPASTAAASKVSPPHSSAPPQAQDVTPTKPHALTRSPKIIVKTHDFEDQDLVLHEEERHDNATTNELSPAADTNDDKRTTKEAPQSTTSIVPTTSPEDTRAKVHWSDPLDRQPQLPSVVETLAALEIQDGQPEKAIPATREETTQAASEPTTQPKPTTETGEGTHEEAVTASTASEPVNDPTVSGLGGTTAVTQVNTAEPAEGAQSAEERRHQYYQESGRVRQELEDALSRIENKVKAEKAARIEAEEALQRSLSQNPLVHQTSTATAAAANNNNTAQSTWHAEFFAIRAELHAMYSELQRAQQAVQRADVLMDRMAAVSPIQIGNTTNTTGPCGVPDQMTGMSNSGNPLATPIVLTPKSTTSMMSMDQMDPETIAAMSGYMSQQAAMTTAGYSPDYAAVRHNRPPQHQGCSTTSSGFNNNNKATASKPPPTRPQSRNVPTAAKRHSAGRSSKGKGGSGSGSNNEPKGVNMKEGGDDRFETTKVDRYMINHASKWNA